MSTAQKPDESLNTALAVQKDDLAALTPAQRAAIAQRKNANIVAAQMAGTSWGKGMDVTTQRAVADWGQRHAIDVATEIHVLGGNIYLSAQFYLNRLVDLVRNGRVLDFRQRFINKDERLEAIAKETLRADATDEERAEVAAMRAEMRERRALRIAHNVPENAISAVLTEVVLVTMPHSPFAGVKWAPRNDSDPVGKAYPQEAALTRSARRALKQCIRHLPEVATYVSDAEDDAAANVDHVLRAHQARELAAVEQRSLAAGPADFSQSVDEAAHTSRERMVSEPAYVRTDGPTPLSRELIAKAAGIDPYGDEAARLAGDTTPFEPDPPAPVEGPVVENLFGEAAPMEPTAEERAMREAAEAAELAAEDARTAAEDARLAEAAERNAKRKK